MNWSEEPPNGTPPAAGADGTADDSGAAAEAALYLGDRGELPLETRTVLVQLLSGPFVDGQRHPKLWTSLVRDEAILRGRLSELFLELVMDGDRQVAFTRQADTGDLETPRLLRRAKLTFIDSVLLLLLRQQLTQAEAQGERAVTSSAEIIDSLGVYQRHDDTDRALFERRVQAAIEKVRKYSMLRKIPASDNRFEISPTLKLLFSAEEIQALTRSYEAIGDGSRLVSPAGPEEPGEGAE